MYLLNPHFLSPMLQEKLISILATIHKNFRLGELAYLAVTSKIENPLRDRIAFALHDQIGDRFLVHREWKDKHNKKADITVTDMDDAVNCLIECKAHSAPTYERGYSDLTRKDLKKMYDSSDETTECYFIFFFNHVHSLQAIDPQFRYAIKYWRLLNNALGVYQYAQDMTDQIHAHWHRHMTDIKLDVGKSKGVRIEAGNYYGMQVFVHAYVYGPVFREELKEQFDGLTS
jgi:hypothetical protein